MWEKDKELLTAFRSCFSTLLTSMKEGEEVDLSSACIEETEALTTY